jgi:hypothetical protein
MLASNFAEFDSPIDLVLYPAQPAMLRKNVDKRS